MRLTTTTIIFAVDVM